MDWLALLGDRRPTEQRLWEAWKKILNQRWMDMPESERSPIRRWVRHTRAHRTYPLICQYDPSHARWPGWEQELGPRPDEGELLTQLLQTWAEAHPDHPAVRRRRLGKVGIRFEVLSRDGFKCRYCGRSAPDVVLHVDHVHPRSKGGEDTLENLVASCRECNLGKRDVLLPALVEAQ